MAKPQWFQLGRFQSTEFLSRVRGAANWMWAMDGRITSIQKGCRDPASWFGRGNSERNRKG